MHIHRARGGSVHVQYMCVNKIRVRNAFGSYESRLRFVCRPARASANQRAASPGDGTLGPACRVGRRLPKVSRALFPTYFQHARNEGTKSTTRRAAGWLSLTSVVPTHHDYVGKYGMRVTVCVSSVHPPFASVPRSTFLRLQVIDVTHQVDAAPIKVLGEGSLKLVLCLLDRAHDPLVPREGTLDREG